MKRLMLYATALISLSVPLALRAQDVPEPLPQTDSMHGGGAQRTPDQVLRFYSAKLALTEDQKAQLKPLIAERQQKVQDLRSDSTLRPRDKVKKLQAINAESDRKINAALTPDQQKKYADVEKQMREQMQERRQQQKNP